jgi:dihydrofolate reductase
MAAQKYWVSGHSPLLLETKRTKTERFRSKTPFPCHPGGFPGKGFMGGTEVPRKSQPGRAKNAGRPTRRVRYAVAMSLDGFIAGPSGEFDWIIMDPEIDFRAIYRQFDTMVMGRRTFEVVKEAGGRGLTRGMQVFVFSRTLRQKDNPGVTIADDPEGVMAGLRSKPGKDVWLFGGGSLFRSLAELGLVDTVEVAVIPVLLGQGLPLLPPPAKRVSLKLTGHRLYAKTGIMSLEYAVQHGRRAKRRR